MLSLILVLLMATIGSSHDPFTIVSFKSTDGTSQLAPYYTATRIVTTLNNDAMGKSRQPSTRIQNLLYRHAQRNQTISPFSETRLSPSEAGSSYLPTPTAYIYRHTILTQEASHPPPSSSSLATIVTAVLTVHAFTNDNGTVADAFTEPSGVATARSVVPTISDIADICLRLLNTLVAIYHIRMTMELLGQCRFIIGLGLDLLMRNTVLYHRHAPDRRI